MHRCVLTVTVYTYLLVRQPGSTAGSRVVFPDRRLITWSPVVPLSPLGNSWHTNFPKGGFGGCESMHLSGGGGRDYWTTSCTTLRVHDHGSPCKRCTLEALNSKRADGHTHQSWYSCQSSRWLRPPRHCPQHLSRKQNHSTFNAMSYTKFRCLFCRRATGRTLPRMWAGEGRGAS